MDPKVKKRLTLSHSESHQGSVSEIPSRVISCLAQVYDLSGEVVSSGIEQLEKNGKQFCVGLLENQRDHAWRKATAPLPEKARASIAGSLFLMRKVLPVPPNLLQELSHQKLMRSPAPPVQDDYYRFIRKQVGYLFRPGWDRKYAGYCERYIPTDSACLECSKSKGGAKKYLREDIGHGKFLHVLRSGTGAPTTFPVKFSIVRTSGKDRGITIASAWSHLLGPLHQMIYDRLTGTDWLLRGEAKSNRFRSFREVGGEVFVSGDYESATDNLNQDVSEFILSCILDACQYVPPGIREYALLSLRATIRYSDGSTVEQQRGQMMGNYLSFPLLCLSNYLAFRRLVPRKGVPVKINGDDIIFRCRPDEYATWSEGVHSFGLTLSRGKTLVNKRMFSLNSSFFYASSRRVRGIPVIRSSMLAPGENGLPPTGESFRRFCHGWRDGARLRSGGEKKFALQRVGALFLDSHRRSICATGRSVEALGIQANNGQIFSARLTQRESYHRASKIDILAGLPEEPLPPMVMKGRAGKPDGWVQVPKRYLTSDEIQDFASKYAFEAYYHSWSCNFKTDVNAWWNEVKRPNFEASWREIRYKFRRTLYKRAGFSLSLYLNLRPLHKFRREAKVWVPAEERSKFSSVFSGVGH